MHPWRLECLHVCWCVLISQEKIYFSQSIQDGNMRYNDEKKDTRLDKIMTYISIYNKYQIVTLQQICIRYNSVQKGSEYCI